MTDLIYISYNFSGRFFFKLRCAKNVFSEHAMLCKAKVFHESYKARRVMHRMDRSIVVSVGQGSKSNSIC